MDIEALEQRYQSLYSDFRAGRINPATFATEVDLLSFQDGAGRYWMIGAQSGGWYYYEGQGWQPGNLRQIAPPLAAPAYVAPAQAVPNRRRPEALPIKTLFMVPVKFMWLTGLAL